MLKHLIREPLVHFLLLGALLFGWSAWQGGSGGTGSNRIVITPGVVDYLAAGFQRTWRRPPNDLELKGLIDEHVKEEIAAREALAMGLERDDTVIKRRLRQKLEFLLVDDASAAPPTDAELKGWLDRHPEAFRVEPQLAFRQVAAAARTSWSVDGGGRHEAARQAARGRAGGGHPGPRRRLDAAGRHARWSRFARWQALSGRTSPTR